MKTSRRRTIGSSITNGRMRIIYVRDSIRVLPSFLKEVLGTEAISASVSFRNWTFCRHASKCSRCVSAACCRLVELESRHVNLHIQLATKFSKLYRLSSFFTRCYLFFWFDALQLLLSCNYYLFLSVKFLVTCNLVYSVLNNITSQFLFCYAQ